MSARKWMLALIAALLWLIGGTPAHAAGAEFRVPSAGIAASRVTFTAETGLEDTARRLAPGVARALARIESDLENLPRVEHVEVMLVKHAADLARVAPRGHSAPLWAAGVAWPDVGTVAVAARAADGSLIDMESTLAHELAHMALERALGPGRAPRWLHEGFAYQHSSTFEWDRAEKLGLAMFRGDLMPIQALESSFPARHDGVSLAYAESYEFVGFLATRGRWQDVADDGERWAFRRFLAEIASGASLDAAGQHAFGRTIEQLDTEWLESVRTRYMWYPVAALGGMFWVVLAFLAVLGWRRRRRQFRARLAQMEIEEALAAEEGLRPQASGLRVGTEPTPEGTVLPN